MIKNMWKLQRWQTEFLHLFPTESALWVTVILIGFAVHLQFCGWLDYRWTSSFLSASNGFVWMHKYHKHPQTPAVSNRLEPQVSHSNCHKLRGYSRYSQFSGPTQRCFFPGHSHECKASPSAWRSAPHWVSLQPIARPWFPSLYIWSNTGIYTTNWDWSNDGVMGYRWGMPNIRKRCANTLRFAPIYRGILFQGPQLPPWKHGGSDATACHVKYRATHVSTRHLQSFQS